MRKLVVTVIIKLRILIKLKSLRRELLITAFKEDNIFCLLTFISLFYTIFTYLVVFGLTYF